MLLVAFAWACDTAVLSKLPPPTEYSPDPVVERSGGRMGEVRVAGVRVSFQSTHPLSDWAVVLARPEDQDVWHPAEFGTRRVERLDPSTIFQQLDIRFFWGAVQVRRQLVVGITWLERSSDALRNCWTALDPEPWAASIAPWVDDSPFQRHVVGAWDLHRVPEGTSVSYTLWADTGAMPTNVQSWAMSRTLPDLMRAFEQHVDAIAASGR